MTVTAILTVLVMLGASARLTRLITEDTITGPLRLWVMKRSGPDGWWYLWVRCPWCVGLWIAFGVTLAVWIGEQAALDYGSLDSPLLPAPGWLWVPGLALTNNYVAARLQA